MIKFVSAASMINKAKTGRYAVAHFNINNLEWTKSILEIAQETNSPVIIGVSEGAMKYMGGYKTVHDMVFALLNDLKITVPVALHLDHGQSVESCKKALDAGFSSVMFDGSHLEFNENVKGTKEVVAYAKKTHASVEAEAGTIGGEEDGVIGNGEIASEEDCMALADLGIDFLAAGIGNIHGKYPAKWDGLKFDVLEKLSVASKKPMVLHGGSGIPKDQVLKAISLGISKINVNTELQEVFADAIEKYVTSGKLKEDKGFDPRKIFKPGMEAIKTKAKELLTEFGSLGKA
ncbi:class II fructose-1,6-bisphosphate aldolase [Spiroplasma sp. AdecLV25b]|uniref:class II fructose-1,6-bisphosphate aldolase n=1 Tax=Spiroplasma sp. AdecLV25b TaxID=3027162 RepID=UPI0027E03E60|nr:class II fructose-1,6-bisphosphate aldolase [Spiroplasma sp. AdecLV25b]